MKQILIDKFIMPREALHEFTNRMNINRSFIKTLPGFVEDAVYEGIVEPNILTYVTIAVWQDEEAIQKAKDAVQAEYKREGFNMPAMLERLNIKIDRGIYRQIHEAG